MKNQKNNQIRPAKRIVSSGKKKKILYHSDFSLAKTGFGRAAKAILTYLYDTNKYEIIHYCCGIQKSNSELKRTPWKSIGCLPDEREEIEKILRENNKSKSASYGDIYLDQIIKQEKPDIYIGVQDIWGLDFAIKSPWFDKINSIIWTTLDSLPILPDAIQYAKKIKNYWIWSNFASKELNRLGYDQVIEMNGPIEDKYFFKISDEEKAQLRKRFNLDEQLFVVGFVFRNQLRKSLPNLLDGYSKWKKENPTITNTAILLHTSWKEGWNIHKLAKEYSIPLEEILTTYICKNCKNYKIQSFVGDKIKCNSCGQNESMTTISVNLGVTEEQLNEIYNIMDVYCHPFTSGGQEIPIQEAKLTELIALVTAYSCGEEMCEDIDGTIPLKWNEYREHGTEFKKASTDPNSIKDNIDRVYNMNKEERSKRGKASRAWTLNKFSIRNVGSKIEKILDTLPDINFDFNFKLNNLDTEEAIKLQILDQETKKNILILNIDDDINIFYALFAASSIKKRHPNEDLYLIVKGKYMSLFEADKNFKKIINMNDFSMNDKNLKTLKDKFNVKNLIILDDYSAPENWYLKLNETNIEIDI